MGGAQEAVRIVASEGLDELAAELVQGTRVFLDTSFMRRADQPTLHALDLRFRLAPRVDSLFLVLPQ